MFQMKFLLYKLSKNLTKTQKILLKISHFYVLMNHQGSFQCQCLRGYFFENNVCGDIDECKSETHLCVQNADWNV